MNCKQSEQLIPLFVEADLDAAVMQQVTTHIETCNSCCNLAAEFQASQLSLRMLSSPEFDEAMMAELRRTVRREIAPTHVRPSITDLLSSRWHLKAAFAVSLVLLMSAIVYFRQETKQVRQETASHNQTVAPDLSKPIRNETETKTSVKDRGFHSRQFSKKTERFSSRTTSRNLENTVRQASAENTNNQIAVAAPVSARESDEDATRISNINSLISILPPVPQAERATSSLEKSAPEPEMLRMEFQTADPNIKIIWLTPKEPTRTNPVADTK